MIMPQGRAILLWERTGEAKKKFSSDFAAQFNSGGGPDRTAVRFACMQRKQEEQRPESAP
jgi:hypothetical protein